MKANKQTLKKISDEYKVLAVSGKMASGKNFICSKMKELGWASIDADILVHDAIDLAADQILQAFGNIAKEKNINLVTTENKIDRRALGSILFENKALLAKQESIVYPIITEKIKAFIQENPKAIINATVLYKTPELLNCCQAVLYVKAPFIKRLCRAKKRDNLSIKQILKRFKSQKKLFVEYKNTGAKIIVICN